MRSYRLSLEAEADLVRIYRWGVREFGEAQADKYYGDLIKRFEQIVDNPYLYQSADDIRKGYRMSVYRNDSIYYRVKNGAVEIMAILGKQDAEGWL